MTELEQRKAAQAFADKWLHKKGYEKGETHAFWLELLQSVLGVSQPNDIIRFEVPIQLSDLGDDADKHTSFIDAVIPATRVLIEQKSASRDLDKKAKQSDGEYLSPFEQARRYDLHQPVSQHARYIVLCNFRKFEIYDCEYPQAEPTVITLDTLDQNIYRLRFLATPSDSISPEKQEISVKAGEIVSELYDKLLACYVDPSSPATLQSLNKLCVRLVFCLYAEDAELFNTHTQFHDYLAGAEPKNIRTMLRDLFRVLNTKEEERDPYELPELLAFPYINGGLFSDNDIEIPLFNEEIVDLLLNKASASFKWRDISPTIFGALFESTLNPETRRQGGMHYTSVENIHKVIDPLFLDDLKSEFQRILNVKSVGSRERQLKRFHDKLASLQFLDPACGSGNFLTETYLSLRRLENDVIRSLFTNSSLSAEVFNPIKVSIGQFYGIEINDFAVTVARTALWIAESQMMQETIDIVGHELDFLPLKSYPNITEANALTLPWSNAVNYEELTYIIGNPPFSGYSMMSKEQKQNVLSVFGKDWKGAGMLDFVCAWFKKASDIIGSHPEVKAAFVATNSICQGTSVANLWEGLNKQGIEIAFAYRSFVWDNEATEKAHVYCVVIGLQSAAASKGKDQDKLLFTEDGVKTTAAHINAYLTASDDVFIHDRDKPICDVPKGGMGSKPVDGGYYMFTPEEKEAFLRQEPQAAPYFHPWFGADELIKGKRRFCLYLAHCSEDALDKLPLCRERGALVTAYRLKSTKAATVRLAERPFSFESSNIPDTSFLAVPKDSSYRRQYIPMVYMQPHDGLCGDKLRLFPNITLYHFSVLTSSVHMTWVRAVCGRLKMDLSYSNTLVYNNFPWPTDVPETLQQQLEQTAQAILDARSAAQGATLAQLYDPALMPTSLRKAHQANDRLVMQAYGFAQDLNEAQILSKLFDMYKERIAELEEQTIAKAKAKPKRMRSAIAKAPDTTPASEQPAKPAKRTRKASQA